MTPVGIHGIATAYPSYCFTQDDILAKAAEVFGHRPEVMARMAGSYGNAGVKRRNSCVPLDWYRADHGWPERAALFETHAVQLLTEAGGRALAAAGIAASDVAATVTVSSTGFVTPSLDSLLQEPMGLPPSVQRLPVFGLGCAGGVIGLARAAAMARAMPGQWVLFLCTELCGLTFRSRDDSKANIIATAIFGDGAAAVVLRAGETGPAPAAWVRGWGEHTWPGTRDIMGWTVEDDGLGVVFSRSIPALVREKMRPATDAFLAAQGLSQDDMRGLIMHPGGERVLEALEDSYGLDRGGLVEARAVLADHGNMSAVTVLAVLRRVVAGDAHGPHLMAALGPGFSVGMCLLELI